MNDDVGISGLKSNGTGRRDKIKQGRLRIGYYDTKYGKLHDHILTVSC